MNRQRTSLRAEYIVTLVLLSVFICQIAFCANGDVLARCHSTPPGGSPNCNCSCTINEGQGTPPGGSCHPLNNPNYPVPDNAVLCVYNGNQGIIKYTDNAGNCQSMVYSG